MASKSCTIDNLHNHTHSHNHEHNDNHSHDHHCHSDGCHCHDSDSLISISSDLTEEEIEYKKFKKQKITFFLSGIAIYLAALFSETFNIQYLTTALFLVSYIFFGAEVLKTAFKNMFKGNLLDENFLMSISTIGAIALGQLSEAVFVMLFYQLGESFQEAAVFKSRKSIKSLMDIRPDFAWLKEGGNIIKKEPSDINVGDTIVVKAGERIPLDGIIIKGSSQIDSSALTGESVPRSAKEGDSVLSGSINVSGLLEIETTSSFGDSTAVKIVELAENASENKSHTEKFITKFAKVYTPIVVALAAILAFLVPIVTPAPDFGLWFGRALIFLVISCPCALVLSVPMGFFAGIGAASKKGVLIKGGNYIQALKNVDTVVFDKTGTLTEGVFEVSGMYPSKGHTEDELLKYAAQAESMSNHPIAKSIMNYVQSKNISYNSAEKFEEISGRGISIVSKDIEIYAGNDTLMKDLGISVDRYNGVGSVVYVAAGKEYIGHIVVSDKIKSDSKMAVSELKNMGIKNVVMLTGDIKSTADLVAKEIGIDNVYSELLPADKLNILNKIKAESNGKVAFVGDGINDAPVLAGSDVGIAMGGIGSDAAIEAADIVIMNDSPAKIVEAIKSCRKTNSIVTQNIVFSLGIKIAFMILGVFGIATMWTAVFADVGVSLIAVANSMRQLAK